MNATAEVARPLLPTDEAPACAPDLAGLLRAALGARWFDLHPEIRARFTLCAGASDARYVGLMGVIERSFLGALLARVLRFARVLPHQRARDVAFRFDVAPLAGRLGWEKCRLYRFADEDFRFASRMTLDEDGVLRERFAGCLGMNLELAVARDDLLFLDRGYFVHLGRFRFDLPRWMGPGRFVLIHRNIDRERFEVLIDIRHAVFGHLVHQRGVFWREG